MAENHRKLLKHLTTAKHCENSWTLLKSADNGSKLLKTIDYAKATIQKETGLRKKIFKKNVMQWHNTQQHTTEIHRNLETESDNSVKTVIVCIVIQKLVSFTIIQTYQLDFFNNSNWACSCWLSCCVTEHYPFVTKEAKKNFNNASYTSH